MKVEEGGRLKAGRLSPSPPVYSLRIVKPWEGGGLAARERASMPREGAGGGARSETSLMALAVRSVRVREGGGPRCS